MRMQRFIPLVLVFSLAVAETRGQSLSWATQAGGLGVDTAEAVGVDSTGNSYVIGNFNVQATFGAGEFNETTLNSAGAVASQDIFVAKYDATGALMWANGIGGTDPASGGNAGIDRGWGIAVDGAGNSYVTGTLFGFTTFADFGNGVAGPFDPGAFVAKYDTNGNAAWATSFAPGGQGFSIDVDSGSNSYVTGHAPDPILGGEIVTVWKLDSNGNILWERQATGGQGRGHDIATDSLCNSYVTGRFGGTVTFGPGELTQTVLTAGNPTGEGFVAKYDSLGNLVWAKQSLSDIGSWGEGIDVDIDENNYVTGIINGTTTFGSAPNDVTLIAQHVGDMFVAKYDSAGQLVWAKHGPGNFNASGMAISVDGSGNSYLTGFFGLTITFASGEPNETTLLGLGGGDIFVAKYASDGGFEWATQAGGSVAVALGDTGNGISVDASGNAYVAGFFTDSATFGIGEPNETVLTSDGQSDVFVAKYMNNLVQPVLDLDIAGFRVTSRVDVSRGQSVNIRLVVRNAGAVNGMADATVVGMQGGGQVYNEIISVSDPVGNGRTTFNFSSFTPSVAGDITWTATIADQDPDVDEEVKVTRVVP